MDTRIFTDAEIKEFGENFNQRLHYDATTNTVSISLDKVSIRSPAQIDEGERVVRRFFAQHASKGKAHMIVNYEGFDCRLELQKKWGEVAIAFEKELYLSVRRLGQAAYPNPAMSKYTILVTGSTDGIGQETALQLAKQGHHVILHGRNAERLVAAAEFIKQEVGVGAKLDTVIGDLSSLTAVRVMVAEVTARFPTLRVIVNNAGVLHCEKAQGPRTEDGFEEMFGVNYIAPFVLTLGLLPLLKQNKPSRIISVSSKEQSMYGMESYTEGKPAPNLDWDNLNCDKSYHWFSQYALSKLGNTMFTNELTRRLRADPSFNGVTANSLRPGVVDTKLFRLFGDEDRRGMDRTSRAKGVAPVVFLASSPDVEGISGRYYGPDCAECETNPIARREADLKRMWDFTIKAAKITSPPI